MTDESDLLGGASATPKTENQRNSMRAALSDQMACLEKSKLSYEGIDPLSQMQSAITQKGCNSSTDGNTDDLVRKPIFDITNYICS